MLRLIAYSLVSVLGIGCSAKALKVGENDNQSPIDINSAACQDASAQITLPTWPTPDGCVVGNEMASLVGVWEGYFQGSAIGDEQSTFRITIRGANAQKGLCGTVSFGTHTAAVPFPPPATDPTAAYPDPAVYPQLDVWSTSSGGKILGLPYTILNGKIDGQRVTLGYGLYEPYNSWCELQTPYLADANCSVFFCAPNAAAYVDFREKTCQLTDTQTHQGVSSVSCSQYLMCSMGIRCECNAQGCVAADGAGGGFDLVFGDGQATGVGERGNVILQRVSTAN